jgi:hypothetical protein
MNFRISGLAPERFAPLFALADPELTKHGAKRLIVQEPNATPCRVSLEEAAPGEEVLLLPHRNVEEPSPYQSSGPIFVRRIAGVAARLEDRLPEMQLRRLSAVRSYDENGWMLACEVVPGVELEALIRRYLADSRAAFLNVHNARPGCFAFRVERG